MTTNSEETKVKSSKNSKDVYGAVGRSNVLMFDPKALVIVTDPKHPLYDERHALPVSEPMVLNIMHQGVIEPVVITKDPETGQVLVVDGRQRVKCAIEANRRLKAKGCEPVQVMGVPRRGDGAALAGVMVSTNEIRQDDTPMNRAKKMARLIEMGRTEADLALLFGCSGATVKNCLALLDCSAPVRKAVETGALPVTAAYKMSKLDPEVQKTTLDSMLTAAGDEKSKRKRGKKMREASGNTPSMRGKRDVLAFLAKLEEQADTVDPAFMSCAKAMIGFFLGGREPRISRVEKAA